jgi:hypothetical protein
MSFSFPKQHIETQHGGVARLRMARGRAVAVTDTGVETIGFILMPFHQQN